MILLDTSAVLFLLNYPEKFGRQAMDTLNTADKIYVSTVSLWEIAIKAKAGKLDVVLPIRAIPRLLKTEELGLERHHTDAYLEISLLHKDPFDTMLVAQAKTEGMELMTTDQLLLDSSYPTIDARL